MRNGRPEGLPICEHGRRDFRNCPDCKARDKIAEEAVAPLAVEFWEYLPTGGRDLNHILYQAYRMGQRAATPVSLNTLEYLKTIDTVDIDIDAPLDPADE